MINSEWNYYEMCKKQFRRFRGQNILSRGILLFEWCMHCKYLCKQYIATNHSTM